MINDEKGDILLCCRYGDRLLSRFTGRSSLSEVSEGNAEITGVKKKE